MVNWLASIGLVGSWFFSCVISMPRKSEKFPASDPSGLVLTAFAAWLAAWVAAGWAMVVATFIERFLLSGCDINAGL